MEQNQLFIKMVLQAWNSYTKRVDQFLDGLKEEQWQMEIAPGRNRISYLVGHLIAVQDRMIELFSMGSRSFPNLDEAFLSKPDRATEDIPSPAELKSFWKRSTEELAGYFNKMTPEDWFAKHSAVSDEDFTLQPERNKLNLLMNRTNHLAYHYGQLILVK